MTPHGYTLRELMWMATGRFRCWGQLFGHLFGGGEEARLPYSPGVMEAMQAAQDARK